MIMHCNPDETAAAAKAVAEAAVVFAITPSSLSLALDEPTPKTGYVAIQRAAPPTTVQPSMISPLSLF